MDSEPTGLWLCLGGALLGACTTWLGVFGALTLANIVNSKRSRRDDDYHAGYFAFILIWGAGVAAAVGAVVLPFVWYLGMNVSRTASWVGIVNTVLFGMATGTV